MSTAVTIALPDSTGRHYMRWTPYRYTPAAGGGTPPPALRRVLLTEGAGTFEADPTIIWYVIEPLQKTGRYVQVPDAGPVAYTDLTVVNPATLDPAATPEPAWTAALGEVAARVGALEADGVGTAGRSAYQIAVDNGFTGTATQWLTSLHSTVAGPASTVPGPSGNAGLSAYQLAQAAGFVGSPQQWLDSLKATTNFTLAPDDADVLRITI